MLKHSGLKMGDIYAVELIGGATRVPKIQVTHIDNIFHDLLPNHLTFTSKIVGFVALSSQMK